MELSVVNNVKIYNLTAGKSLPDWLSSRKKRTLLRNDVAARKRLELIQDFAMPHVSHNVKISKDGEFILCTGTHKPTIRCYDVNELSLKFERCMDNDILKFEILSDDYSKLVFLQNDRYIEFHYQGGRYYRLRMPRNGTDMAYHALSCDMFFVGDSSEIYRLNLEQGRFLKAYVSDASAMDACKISTENDLLVCGTREGRVEAWDPRMRTRAAVLDCALSCITEDTEVIGVPSVTSLSFKGGLTMAVGTATGQILIYDIRSDKPLQVKDHMYGLPIKNLEFHKESDVIYSMDKKILKMWNYKTAKAVTSIEPGTLLNDLCVVPNSGLLFMANDHKKVLTYYIPSLGPAPKWCSFLDSLTEEMEEKKVDTVYDDYKFVTVRELEELGLGHLIGSELVRAYMHGYFMDIRLYNRAKSITDPFAFTDYRKDKIKQKLEVETSNRVVLNKLPKVNTNLAKKLMVNEDAGNQKQKLQAHTLLKDERFKALFENPDYQVDELAEEYRLINPIVSSNDQKNLTKPTKLLQQFEQVDEVARSESESSEIDSSEESSDDDQQWTKEVQKQYRMVKREEKIANQQEERKIKLKPTFYELKPSETFAGVNPLTNKKASSSKTQTLGERLAMKNTTEEIVPSGSAKGNQEMTFKFKKRKRQDPRETMDKHLEERKNARRSVKGIEKKMPPKFFGGKRVS